MSGSRTRLRPPPSRAPRHPIYDYFHINSIEPEANGNFLVSARNTHTLYEIDRKTKKILWRLGGKKSDFKMGPGTNFEWQHDARRQADGTITIFDNGAAPPVEKFSRVLVLRVNTADKKATLVRSYHHPDRLLAPFEGNAQFLPNGNVFVGWGAQPYVSELSKSGALLFDAYFGDHKPPGKDADTYRAYRFTWHGHPTDRPVVVVAGDAGLRELERRNRGRALAGAGRGERGRAEAGADRREERLRDSDQARQVRGLLRGEGNRRERQSARHLRSGRAAALETSAWRGGRAAW